MEKQQKLTIRGRVPKDPTKPYPDNHYRTVCVNNNWMDITELTEKQFNHYIDGLKIQILEAMLKGQRNRMQNLIWSREALERVYATKVE